MQEGVSRAALNPDCPDRFWGLRDQLGVTGFGLNQMILRPGERGRIHRHERQEEVYLVLEGELAVELEGGQLEMLAEGELIRVAPSLKRQLSNRKPERCLFVALGGAGEHRGRDGEAFAEWHQEPGAPPQEVPMPPDLEL